VNDISVENSPSLQRQPFEPELVLIPAGEFLMGSDPNRDKDTREDEQPQHKLYLPDYYIAKTPVTYAQYAAFVEAGHKPPKHWSGQKPPQGKKDHPVVNVSWHDAMAYCKWLSEATSKPYRLPSEAEWEKAARGMDGRIYPWGDEWDAKRCNVKGIIARLLGVLGISDGTTPVGAYPQGASPYGVLDMAGNVREWTTTLWGRWIRNDEFPDFGYPYDPKDGRENLEVRDDNNIIWVVRGGSWIRGRNVARCAFRDMYYPEWDRLDLGFRLCVAVRQD
jgi:formylglycine-generating enzyme required for sulfatase activity